MTITRDQTSQTKSKMVGYTKQKPWNKLVIVIYNSYLAETT